jgi:two-component system, OmpR family, sensor histidine kinase BaeS
LSWSLRTRLALSYMLVALLCVLLVSALANGLLDRQFRGYVRDSRERKNQQIADLIAGQYRQDDTWDDEGLAVIGMNALEQGVVVSVSGREGVPVWDAMEHNSGLCEQMISHMARNMESRYPNWRGAYTLRAYPVRSGPREIGSVSIGYYGPFFFNDEDLSFINALNRLLLWVAFAALVLALGAALLMARGISGPVGRVLAATQAMAAGNLDTRLPERTRVREIDRLTAAVNELSRTLRAQQALRKRLTADMAHELRTPLATLQSHLEALIDGIWAPDRGRLTELHDETLRMSRLVADLEDLARYERGVLSLARCETDVVALVARIVRNHQAQYGQKGVRLGLTLDTAVASASLDADKASQAVINLLSNALKFTPPGGTVEVRVGATESGVEIRVKDTGIGIAAADLPLVFERLYRADSSRSRSTGGSGIGLSIAKAIVEAHGGTLSAMSEPGRGSEFTVFFQAETRGA